ncbi:YdeI/OmpD-associated family protein [Paenisporosarcina sp. OV554]|uniref:YdeI/OmpD-associated family protein n=1 Tax=Paenisporosarcina sp. OV554 TaxID=2135694 RepID=UPI000D347CF5|nr:YdeI/OmpD-associated family protein [Paenisporosarcina sp. OV554]PUB11171.1 bacteriocin resistance YdeI/OmpD-like protein [Paenisporosarcina sp. OV554]
MNSTKSVIEKLNINKYPTKLILQAPEDIDDFNEVDFDTTIKNDKYHFIFAFVFSMKDFSQHLEMVINKNLVEDSGYLFIAYPKKNNKKYKEFIERDSIFNNIVHDEDGYVHGSTLKFSKMISLNDVFTVVGLKSVPKKTKNSTSTKNSQCVDDYIRYIDDIKQYLSLNEKLLATYNQLTFGYQKDWARYVYSAKRQETQEKRLLEMETIIGEGYKSIDLYRRKKE